MGVLPFVVLENLQKALESCIFKKKIQKSNRGVHFFMKPLKFSTKNTKKVRIFAQFFLVPQEHSIFLFFDLRIFKI